MTKFDDVKKMIQGSPLLSESERAEWSQLLLVMNDKQLSELKEILNPLNNAQAQKDIELQKQVSGELSHIANVPKSVTEKTVSPQSIAERPTIPYEGMPMKTFKKPIESTPLRTELSAPKRLFSSKQGISEISSNRTSTKPAKQEFIVPDYDVDSRQEVATETRSAIIPTPPTQNFSPPQNISDIQKLSVGHIRFLDFKALSESVKSVVGETGYTEVLLALEDSPLYQSYLAMGRRVLEESVQFGDLEMKLKNSGENYLTKLEFEKVTDLLHSMQVN